MQSFISIHPRLVHIFYSLPYCIFYISLKLTSPSAFSSPLGPCQEGKEANMTCRNVIRPVGEVRCWEFDHGASIQGEGGNWGGGFLLNDVVLVSS